MNKINSRHILNFFSRRNSSLSLSNILRNKSFYYYPRYNFSNQQKNDESQSYTDPKMEILDEEHDIHSSYIKKETFLERNKVTIGLATSGIGFYFLGNLL